MTTPAVTRRRSTGVHSRVEYTLDQLDRLTLPPSETGPTVTVNTTTEQAHTDVDDQFAQPEETEALSPDEDDEQHGTAIVESGCHQTLNERFRRHPSDDEDDDEDPRRDSRSISSNSSLGKRPANRRAARPDRTGSSRQKLKKQRDAAAQDLLRLRGGAGNSESQTATSSTINLEQQFDEVDTAATNWETEDKAFLDRFYGIITPEPAGTAVSLGTAGLATTPETAGTAGSLGTAVLATTPEPAGTAGSLGTAGPAATPEQAGTAFAEPAEYTMADQMRILNLEMQTLERQLRAS